MQLSENHLWFTSRSSPCIIVMMCYHIHLGILEHAILGVCQTYPTPATTLLFQEFTTSNVMNTSSLQLAADQSLETQKY